MHHQLHAPIVLLKELATNYRSVWEYVRPICHNAVLCAIAMESRIFLDTRQEVAKSAGLPRLWLGKTLISYRKISTQPLVLEDVSFAISILRPLSHK